MSLKVAINGYGRIGRNIMRALYEGPHCNDIEIVAINDLGDVEINAYLTKRDTTHGLFKGDVSVEDGHLVINGHKIKVLSERDPSKLPWGELNVDMVFECTGFFASRDKAVMHLAAGAKKVLISAPAGTDVDATIVYGVNHSILKATDQVVSNASCTTNCLAPLVKVIDDAFGLESGIMNTIHAYTNDQQLIDVYHKDMRRARSATQSMIPTKTGAAAAVGLVLPHLNGKLDGFAIRVPTINVSVVDLTFLPKREVNIDELNQVIKAATEGELKGVLSYQDEPLVSMDFNHCPYSSNYDSTQTKILGRLVKVLSWYDNEWGFSNRMLDTACAMMAAK